MRALNSALLAVLIVSIPLMVMGCQSGESKYDINSTRVQTLREYVKTLQGSFVDSTTVTSTTILLPTKKE